MAEPEIIAAPIEDGWADTPEARERLRRVIDAADAGNSYRLGEAFLLKLVDVAESAGGALSREGLARLLEDAVHAGEIERVSTPMATHQDG